MGWGGVVGGGLIGLACLFGLAKCNEALYGDGQNNGQKPTDIEKIYSADQSKNEGQPVRDPCKDPYPNPQRLQEMCLEP